MASEDKDRKSMQESWVEVPQQEGTLVHSHSKEKMEELLAAAVAEKEGGGEGEERSSPKLFEVQFAPNEDDDEQEPPYVHSPITEPLILQDPTKVPPIPTPRTAPRTRSCRRVLFLLVPVLLLTHLAFFGIGYYLGRRFSVEKVVTVFHV